MIDLDALERECQERWTGNVGVADGNRILALIQRVRQEENNRDRCAARCARLERALTTVRLRLSASDDIGLGARVLLLNTVEGALEQRSD